MYSNNNNHGRRRQQSIGCTIGGTVTGALVAYGTYRVANWAWNKYLGDDEDNQEEEGRKTLMGSLVDQITSMTTATKTTTPRSDHHTYPPLSRNQWRIRRNRMMSCREEVTKALEGFLPTLKRKIEEQTNTSKETQALKKLRSERAAAASANSDKDTAVNEKKNGSEVSESKQREKELWDTVKIQAVTRMVGTAYANTLLFLVLTVQVNLLGGRLFNKQIGESSTSLSSAMSIDGEDQMMDSYQASHRLVLQSTYEYFFDKGIISLTKAVERAVVSTLQEWDVTDPSYLDVSYEVFQEAIHEIRSAEEEDLRTNNNQKAVGCGLKSRRPRSFLRFLVPPSESFESSTSDEVACGIVDETWDLFESPVLADAQQDCMNITFDSMRDHHWGKIFAAAATTTNASSNLQEECKWETKPLARIVTQLKHTSNSFYSSIKHQNDFGETTAVKPNKYCEAMETLPTVLELADVSFN